MKRFLVPIIIFAVISWGSWLTILNFSSPYLTISNQPAFIPMYIGTSAGKQLTISNIRVAFFLLSFFFSLFFTLTLILYFFYRLIGNPPEDGRRTIRRALRQSFFVSLGIITLAILQLSHTLNPLTFILTAAVVVALELTFRATK